MRLRLTEKTIEELVVATCGAQAGVREKHTLRQALYALVLLARIEHHSEIQRDAGRDVRRATRPLNPAVLSQQSRRRTKMILQQIAERSYGRQLGFAFDQPEHGSS